MDEQRRDQMKAREEENRKKGERAENIANWHFRLNGFLSIRASSYILTNPRLTSRQMDILDTLAQRRISWAFVSLIVEKKLTDV